MEQTPNRSEQALASGAMIGLLGMVLGYAARYCHSVTVSRFLGLEAAGAVFSFLALVQILALLARFGLDTLGMKKIAVHFERGEAGAIRRIAALFGLLIGAGAVIVAAVVILWHERIAAAFHAGPAGAALVVLVFAIPAVALSFASGQFLRAMRLIGLSALVQSVILYGVATVVPWACRPWLGASAGVLCWSFVLGASIAAIAGIGIVMVRARPGVAEPSASALAGALTAAPFLLWISLFTYVFADLGVVLMGLLGTAGQASLYVAALRTAMITSIGLLAVNRIVGPLAASAGGTGDRAHVQEVTRMGARWSLATCALAVGGLLIGGRWILSLFGPHFQAAYVPLLVLMIGQLFNAYTGSVSLVLQMIGQEKATAGILCVVVLLTLPAYYFAIPLAGTLGAAIVTMAGETAWNLWMLRAVRVRTGIVTSADNPGKVGVVLLAAGLLALASQGRTMFVVPAFAAYCMASPFVLWCFVFNAADRRALGVFAGRFIPRRGTPP